uniref:Uncharacterized protein n=2 Tax=Caenorhabditis japonica TaxID=281687 RepID=A0A8R1EV26_CAEJA
MAHVKKKAFTADINHCCAIHKNCYINQREQETCDVNFCKCFDNLIAHNKDSKPCKPVTDSACSGVKIYGQNSYLNLKDSKFNHKNVPSVPKIFQEYSKLYNECPHQMVTLSSCALNHDICMAKKKKNCALPLIQCLVVVEFDVNKNANCGRAIQNILNMLLFSQKPVGNSPTQPIVYRVREGSNNFAAMYHRVALPGNAIFFYFTFFGIILICGLLIVVAYIRMDSPVPTSSIGAPVTSATASPHTPR